MSEIIRSGDFFFHSRKINSLTEKKLISFPSLLRSTNGILSKDPKLNLNTLQQNCNHPKNKINI